MAKRTQYRSASSARIRELLAELHQHKIFPRGYSSALAKKLKLKYDAVVQNMRGRTANLHTIRHIIEDGEMRLDIMASKPPTIDHSNTTVQELVEKRLLPNNFGEQVAEMVGVAPNTVYQITSAGYKSQRIEEGLRQLAGENEELEMVHRLETLIAAAKNKSLEEGP